jgi:hypothetical protein
MYKLYNFNKKVNFFFIPIKDVKRWEIKFL